MCFSSAAGRTTTGAINISPYHNSYFRSGPVSVWWLTGGNRNVVHISTYLVDGYWSWRESEWRIRCLVSGKYACLVRKVCNTGGLMYFPFLFFFSSFCKNDSTQETMFFFVMLQKVVKLCHEQAQQQVWFSLAQPHDVSTTTKCDSVRVHSAW